MSELPPQAERRLCRKQLADGYKLEALYKYQSADGKPLFWRIRLRHPETGDKWIRPMHVSSRGYVLGEPEPPPEGKPLYRLPTILKDTGQPVYIVEGENCVAALNNIGVTATTSGGASSADAADWTPLHGRKCVIWPDNDKAGIKYAEAVANILDGLSCHVEQVDVAALDLPDKGDAVDWLAAHQDATADDVAELPLVTGRPEAPDNIPQGDKVAPVISRRRYPVTRRLSDIEREAIRWLWPGRIPCGKVTMLVGDPGLGKSLVTLAIAATVSRGGAWPTRTEGLAPAGDVVLVSAEDDAADTIRPRLEAAGADLERVHILDAVTELDEKGQPIESAWTLAEIPALRAVISAANDCRLVVIDPISAYLAGTDSHNNADVRAALTPLAKLAADCRAAVLVVSHLNKSQGPAIYRTTGSLAFTAAARAVYCVTKDKEDSGRRLVVPIKANLSPDSTGLAYTIGTDRTDTPRLEWEPDPVPIDDATEALRHEPVERQTERDDAADWLEHELADGPRAVKDLKKEAREAGTSWRTVERAKAAIGAEAVRSGFGPGGGWQWQLKTAGAKTANPIPAKLAVYDETQAGQGIQPDSKAIDRHGRHSGNAGGLCDSAEAYRRAKDGDWSADI